MSIELSVCMYECTVCLRMQAYMFTACICLKDGEVMCIASGHSKMDCYISEYPGGNYLQCYSARMCGVGGEGAGDTSTMSNTL